MSLKQCLVHYNIIRYEESVLCDGDDGAHDRIVGAVA